MKTRQIITQIRILILGSLLILGCKKENVDYRDKYIGKWDFKVDRKVVNTDSIGYFNHDSVSYEGEIIYGDSDNEILIKYTNENSVRLTVAEGGALYDFPTHYCSGEFLRNDSLHLYLRWGGLGGGTKHTIDGVKK